jgi:hypothetical protein
VHGVAPPGGVEEEAGEAREAIEEFDAAVTRPAVAAAEAAGVRAVVQLVDERPARALVDAADEHDAEVIVVGIWNESPLRGLLLGSVAHKLLQLSDRPVLCLPGAPERAQGVTGTSRPSSRAATASSASSAPGRPTSCTATGRPATRTGTTTAGSPARFHACV